MLGEEKASDSNSGINILASAASAASAAPAAPAPAVEKVFSCSRAIPSPSVFPWHGKNKNKNEHYENSREEEAGRQAGRQECVRTASPSGRSKKDK